jgi:hypothetical protein
MKFAHSLCQPGKTGLRNVEFCAIAEADMAMAAVVMPERNRMDADL